MAHRGEWSSTLPELFSRALARRPDRVALMGDALSLTYGELDRTTNRIASALHTMEIGAGDRVATVLSNRPESLVLDIALCKAGAVRLPINPELEAMGIAHVLGDARPTAVVCEPDRSGDLDGHLGAATGDTKRIWFDLDLREVDQADRREADRSPAPGWTSVATVLPDINAPRLAVDVSPSDIAAQFYTGGTTGEPKGVLYSHASLTTNFLAHIADLGFAETDVGLVSTPLAHSGGTFALAALLAGGRVVIQPRFATERWLAAVERYGVTWAFLVPTMLYRVLETPRDEAETESLDRLIYGAAPSRSDRLRDALDRFGPILTQFYGQTEVPNLITLLDREDHRRAVEHGDDRLLQAAGQPCLLAEVAIMDPDGDEFLDVGDRGEVVARAPYAFESYFDNPEATADVVVDDWVRTGDIGHIDESGYLYLLDRRRDVIVTGGMNVYSAEVERAIGEYAAVERVAVIGVPHAEWGEAVHAVLVVEDPARFEERDLAAFLADRIAGYKRPKAYEIVDALPETPFGKVDKAALRGRYWPDGERQIG